MSRNDIPGLVLSAVVVVGVGASVVRRHLARRVIVLGGAVGGPHLAAAVWVVAGCAVVGACLWWWGPIRVDRADLRWRWGGPVDRGPMLSRRRAVTAGVVLVAGVCVALVISVFDPGVTWWLILVGVACAVVELGAATWRQGVINARLTGRARPTLAPRRLHADAVAPDDALPSAARLAAVTMDVGWLGQARVARWQRRRRRGRSHRFPARSLWALAHADLIRLTRRPGDVVIVAAVIAATAAVPMTTHVVCGGPLLLTVLAYRVGSATASGLATFTQTPALDRALCAPRWHSVVAFAVAPAVAIVAWTAVAVPFWSVGAAAWPVITAGAMTAALRRATRPDLPYDAPVYVLGQGGATQPLLMFALMRGHVAAVATGLAACLLG